MTNILGPAGHSTAADNPGEAGGGGKASCWTILGADLSLASAFITNGYSSGFRDRVFFILTTNEKRQVEGSGGWKSWKSKAGAKRELPGNPQRGKELSVTLHRFGGSIPPDRGRHGPKPPKKSEGHTVLLRIGWKVDQINVPLNLPETGGAVSGAVSLRRRCPCGG